MSENVMNLRICGHNPEGRRCRGFTGMLNGKRGLRINRVKTRQMNDGPSNQEKTCVKINRQPIEVVESLSHTEIFLENHPSVCKSH